MKKSVVTIALFGAFILAFNFAYGKYKFKKVSRDVKKEAKKYERDGWKVEPGNIPIKNQLDNSFKKQNEENEDGLPKWVIANGSSVAESQAAAEMQAIELAKNRLVSLIESHMKDVITSDVSSNQISGKDAASLTRTIENSTNIVSKRLGRVIPLFKVYREVGHNTEVQVMISYDYAIVQKDMINEIRSELEKISGYQKDKFDKFLNGNAYKSGDIFNMAEPK